MCTSVYYQSQFFGNKSAILITMDAPPQPEPVNLDELSDPTSLIIGFVVVILLAFFGGMVGMWIHTGNHKKPQAKKKMSEKQRARERRKDKSGKYASGD